MIRSKSLRVLAGILPLVTLLAAPSAARAQSVQAVVEHITDGDILTILKQRNLEFEKVKDGVFRLKLLDLKVLLFRKDTNLQLYAGFTTKGKVSCDTINQWNKGKRFSRAYIDDEGDAVIESDMDLEGGVSPKAIGVFIDTFKLSLAAFVKQVIP